MSFFQKLFYGGITVLVSYELYECYKKKGKLDLVAVTECFFSGAFNVAGGVAKDIAKPVIDKAKTGDVLNPASGLPGYDKANKAATKWVEDAGKKTGEGIVDAGKEIGKGFSKAGKEIDHSAKKVAHGIKKIFHF